MAQYRGHLIDFDDKNEEWVYQDTGKPIKKEDGKRERNCPECNLRCYAGKPDPCLGYLPGVAYACCGHGDPDYSYIKFTNGFIVRGFDRIEES